jgi:hypothetical protein
MRHGAEIDDSVRNGYGPNSASQADRDGKNDAAAKEYDQTFEFPIPPGRHRLMLDDAGGDWACVGWYSLTGETLDP